MIRSFCNAATSALAWPIALTIKLADVLLVLVAFPLMAILAMLPEKRK